MNNCACCARANRTRSASCTKVSSDARHHHPVLAGLFQLVAQHGGECEHQVLFLLAARRMGAGIDAAMAGVENDDRPRIAGGFGGIVMRRSAARPPAAGGCRSPRRAGRSRGRPGSTSSTRRAGWPSAGSTTNARVTRTGPVTSITMRERPFITRPKRNALTTPRPCSPVRGGNWKLTWGMSITTR